MNGTAIEVLSTNNGLLVFKLNRDWKRSLVLTVYDWRDKRKYPFSSEQDWIRINSVMADGKCLLRVGMAGLKGLIKNTECHIARPPRNRYLVISGSGRCGTQAIARYLDGAQRENGEVVRSRHETLNEYILPLLIGGDRCRVAELLKGMQHEIESAPYFALCPETIRADNVVHLIRDGRRVVQSGMNRGWYANNSLWNQIKPVFSLDRFENCCHLWRVTTENMTEYTQVAFRLEDLIASDEEKKRLTGQLGIRPRHNVLPHVNQGNVSSDFSRWTSRQKDRFSEICGPMMDRYYPGWQQTWGRAASAA